MRLGRLLLVLEVTLVVGLAWVAIQVGDSLTRLNQHSGLVHYTPPARPTPLPTASATPLVRLVELPGGPKVHAEGDLAPTPAAPPGVRLLLTPLPVLPLAPPTGSPPTAEVDAHATGIVIPAIGVDAPVLHGVGAEALQRGVGHYEGSANPGEAGNVVLAGHNDVYGEVFRDLAVLQAGDEISLYTAARGYRYVLRGWTLVEPDDVSVLEATSRATLTLISCYPYRIDTQRIIVTADLVEG